MVWEKDSVFYSRLYSPGSGWGPRITVSQSGSFGSVVAIPASNHFYAVYSSGSSPCESEARSWLARPGDEEVVSVGLPMPGAARCPRRGRHGRFDALLLGVVGNGNAEAWYSIRSGPPPGPKGTLAGTVRDQFGVGVAGVTSHLRSAAGSSTSGGAYSMSVPVGTYNVPRARPTTPARLSAM